MSLNVACMRTSKPFKSRLNTCVWAEAPKVKKPLRAVASAPLLVYHLAADRAFPRPPIPSGTPRGRLRGHLVLALLASFPRLLPAPLPATLFCWTETREFQSG